MRFIELLPAIQRAHAATRLVIEDSGCQLGSSLLALDLDRQGIDAEYVHGYYSASPDQEHWWVSAGAVLLDPTRDQFLEDPFAEQYTGKYTRVDAKSGGEMAHEATCLLRVNWAYNRRARDAIEQVVAQYNLDLAEVMEPPGLLTPVRTADADA